MLTVMLTVTLTVMLTVMLTVLHGGGSRPNNVRSLSSGCDGGVGATAGQEASADGEDKRAAILPRGAFARRRQQRNPGDVLADLSAPAHAEEQGRRSFAGPELFRPRCRRKCRASVLRGARA